METLNNHLAAKKTIQPNSQIPMTEILREKDEEVAVEYSRTIQNNRIQVNLKFTKLI